MNHKDGRHKFDSVKERTNNESFVLLWFIFFFVFDTKRIAQAILKLFYKHIIIRWSKRVHIQLLWNLATNGQSAASVFGSFRYSLCVRSIFLSRLFAFHNDDDVDSGQFCVLIDTQALHLPNAWAQWERKIDSKKMKRKSVQANTMK